MLLIPFNMHILSFFHTIILPNNIIAFLCFLPAGWVAAAFGSHPKICERQIAPGAHARVSAAAKICPGKELARYCRMQACTWREVRVSSGKVVGTATARSSPHARMLVSAEYLEITEASVRDPRGAWSFPIGRSAGQTQ